MTTSTPRGEGQGPGPVRRPVRAAETDEPRALRIAMVAPPWFELPPRGYGGIEAVVTELVNQLTANGHHVTLVGAGRNGTDAQQFYPVFDVPPSERLGTAVPEMISAAATAEILDGLDVDVVHDHSLAGPLLARGRSVPTVVTMHGPVDGEQGEYYSQLGPSVHVVAISDAQRRLNPDINWVGTVHNAIDVDSYPFRSAKDDYVLWLGRFHPEKGPHLAIDAARRAGRRIVLAGKRIEPAEKAFFEAEIAHRLGPGVEYVGEADADLKRELYAGAESFLFPLQWDEPFGMVMIEAMACGTPVVALRRGSVPEVVAHGISGLVVDHPDELPAALDAVRSIDPERCRAHVVSRFSTPIMTAGYERIYRDVASGNQVERSSHNGWPLAATGSGGPVAVDSDRVDAAAVDRAE